MRIIKLLLCLSIILGNEVVMELINLDEHTTTIVESGEETSEKETKESNEEEQKKKEYVDRHLLKNESIQETFTSQIATRTKLHTNPSLDVTSPPPKQA